MPNQIFEIKGFNAGLITSTDAEDIPRDAATNCRDLDPTANGELKGIFSNETPTVLGSSNISIMDYLNNSGSYVLVANNTGGGIAGATSMVPHNNEIHAGMGYGSSNTPKWYGYVRKNQFSDQNTAPGLTLEEAPIINIYNGSTNYVQFVSWGIGTPSESDYFQPGGRWDWCYTVTYDGYQESPIPTSYTTRQLTLSDTSEYNANLRIHVANIANVNPRITSINLYRRTWLNGQPNSWSLVESIDINAKASTGDYNWSTGVNSYYPDTTGYFADYGQTGTTFENNTGYAETLETISVNYQLSTECAGYNFVANVYNSELGLMPGLIVRSMAGRYDMFDWSNYSLKIPFTPTALISFQDRLYAMSNSRMLRINPTGFYVEDESPGVGCASPNSYAATEFGLIFANDDNIFLYNGAETFTISSDIEDEWRTHASGKTPIVAYDAAKQLIICAVDDEFFMYHTQRKRWDRMTIAVVTTGAYDFCARAHNPSTGNAVLAYTNAGRYLIPFNGGTQQTWSWTSGIFDMGSTQQYKKIYKIKSSYTGTPNIAYSLDGTANQSVTESTGVLNGGIQKFKNIKLTVTSSSPTDTMQNIEIIYRPMIGNR